MTAQELNRIEEYVDRQDGNPLQLHARSLIRELRFRLEEDVRMSRPVRDLLAEAADEGD